MDRWVGRVALVTGASSGIGRAIASRLVEHGLIVVACARRLELLQELKSTHASDKGRLIPIKCDLRKEEEILSMFQRIEEEVGGVDICVNNAGIGRLSSLIDGLTEHWKEMLEVNVLASCICSRETIKSMRERGVDDGLIVNIGSIAGHKYNCENRVGFYGSTKKALISISEGLVSELATAKSRIKIMELDPGLVETEILERSVGKATLDHIFESIEVLSVNDIADCVVFALSAPPKVTVSTLIIQPTVQYDLTEEVRRARESIKSPT